MAWNGDLPTQANWSGNPQFAGGEVLYTTPDPATTTTNPSIGIVDGNEIPLPTSYNNLNVETINGNPVPVSAENWSLYPAIHDVIADQLNATEYIPYTLYLAGALASVGDNDYTCLLAGETLAPPSLLDDWNPAFEYVVNVGYGATYDGVFYIATQTNTNVVPTSSLGDKWRLAEWDNEYAYSTGDLVFVTSTGLWYKANGANTGVSPLDPPPAPPLPAVWTQIQFWTTADYVNPIWNIKGFDDIQSASVNTLTANIVTCNIDGGANALTVNGGTVLDGGIFHGTTIGSLPVSGINTVRVDVLPVGIDLTSATYIAGVAAGAVSWNAGGAANIAAGGAVSIAGGDYIEYNTDQNFFRNTSAGNDYTDIYVGNIHPADGGSANLRINAEGSSTRGVEISDGTDWTTQNINVTNQALVNKLLVLDATAFDFASLSFVKIPESQNLPADWDSANNYDLWDYVIYAPTSTYYFSIVADNLNNDPSTTSGFWLLANWDAATTYLTNYPTFEPASQSFWLSLLDGNTGNFPFIPADWDSTTTYAIDELVVYEALHYKSLENSNVGNIPNEPTPLEWDSGTTYVTNDLVTFGGLRYKSLQSSNQGNDPSIVGSVWWVQVPIWWENVPIWWSPTTNYHLGNTDTGVVFTPIITGSTGITTLVKRVGDPNEELNVIVKNITGVELSAQSVVVTPMYKDFDMNGHNILNLGTITIGDLTVNNLTVDGNLNIHDVYDRTGGNLAIHSGIDLNSNNIINASTISGSGTITVASGGTNTDVVLTPNGTGLIVANKGLNMTSNNITNCPQITGTGAITIASGGTNTSVALSPSGTGLIVANKGLNMNSNNITNCPQITGAGTITVASGGTNTNVALTPNGTGLIVANKGLNMNSNNITNCPQITGTGTITVASGGTNTNVALTPNGTGLIVANKGLDMSSNNITNCPQITGTGTITVASGGTNTNVALTPNGSGLVVANKGLDMTTNSITNCRSVRSDANLSLNTGVSGNITLTSLGNLETGATGFTDIQTGGALTLNSTTSTATLSANNDIGITSATSYITLTAGSGQDIQAHSRLDMSQKSIINCRAVTSDTDLSLDTGTGGVITLNGHNLTYAPAILNPGGIGLAATGGDISLAPGTSASNTNFIQMYNTVNMNGNIIKNAPTITAAGTDLTLTAGSGYKIVAGSELNMNSNYITNCPSVRGNTDIELRANSGNLRTYAPSGTTTIEGSGAVNLNSLSSTTTLAGQTDVTVSSATSKVILAAAFGSVVSIPNTNLDMGSRGLINCRSITSDVDLYLNPASGSSVNTGGAYITSCPGVTRPAGVTLQASSGDISLSPGTSGSNTNFVQVYNTLNLNSNLVTNVAKINGHNIYSYGSFYNSANQTLGASGTATRVKMDTSGTASGITLDTSTNIGRLTFTNAGTYLIEWNGYLVHGSGSATDSYIWIRLNGTDVAGTGKKQKLDTGVNDLSIGSSAQVTVTASQYIEFFWAATGTNVPLTAVAASSPYPATPSFSCSISIIA